VTEGSLSEIFDAPPLDFEGPLLSFRDLRVQFGGVAALAGVTFEVPAREVVAVIGPNGAGKSTLLNAISGLVRDNASGDIVLAGKSVLGSAPVRIARIGVGRSFQDPPMLDKGTVVENVMVGGHLRIAYSMADQIWRRRKVRRLEQLGTERAIEVLRFMDLSDLANERVGGLPYGTRKLIDIARALVSGPHLLLLDEPTSGLDLDEQRAVGRVLQAVHKATGVTILIVEHHMNVVRSIAERVVGLESGTVLAVGTPEEVLDSEVFRSAVVGHGTAREGQVEDASGIHAEALSLTDKPW
jgi:branched-chain amino acid transport system ATP-binding protein